MTMMRNRKKVCFVKRVVKSTENDEVTLTYPNEPEEMRFTLQYMRDSTIGREMYGQEADSWVKVFLEKDQDLNVDDLVAIGSDVYKVNGLVIPHLKHRTVMIKWDSKDQV